MRQEDKRTFELLTDWQLLGLNIDREAEGEPYDGKVAVGTVVLERVDHRKWDGNTIKEVILWPWQFSWTMPEAGKAYYDESFWMAKNWVDAYRKDKVLQECCSIAIGMVNGKIPRDPDLAAVSCCEYLNPKIAKETKEKWLKKGLRVIKTIGRHEFFANPELMGDKIQQ